MHFVYNMNNIKCLLVVFIFLFNYGTLGEEGTMVESIINNCTLNNTFNNSDLNAFRTQSHFSKCKNYSAISSINSQSVLEEEEKINYIRCLLYYETFISFCNHPTSTAQIHKMLLQETIPGNVSDVKEICKGLSLRPKIEDYNLFLWNVTQNEKLCEFVCTDIKEIDLGVNNMCAKSYYHNYMNIGNTSFAKNGSSEHKNQEVIGSTSKVQDHKPIKNLQKTVLISNTPSSVKLERVSNNQDIVESHKNLNINTKNTNVDSEPEMSDANEKYNSEPRYFPGDIAMDPPAELKNIASTISSQPAKVSANLLNGTKKELILNPTNNEKQYVGNYINEQEELDIPQPQKVQEKPRPEEESNAFEMMRKDPFSETYDGDMEGNSYFFTYFTFICVAFILGYIGYHNKQKILALLVEGRQTRRSHRDTRPNSANYHKLDSTLEEAISSSCNKNSSHVIY